MSIILSCPLCHSTVASTRPLPVGKVIRCLQCGTPFPVPAPVAGGVASPPPLALPVAVPAAASGQGSNALALTLVLGGLVLLLGTGLVLAVYCFTAFTPPPAAVAEKSAARIKDGV